MKSQGNSDVKLPGEISNAKVPVFCLSESAQNDAFYVFIDSWAQTVGELQLKLLCATTVAFVLLKGKKRFSNDNMVNI